jgi:hypothetical protein
MCYIEGPKIDNSLLDVHMYRDIRHTGRKQNPYSKAVKAAALDAFCQFGDLEILVNF